MCLPAFVSLSLSGVTGLTELSGLVSKFLMRAAQVTHVRNWNSEACKGPASGDAVRSDPPSGASTGRFTHQWTLTEWLCGRGPSPPAALWSFGRAARHQRPCCRRQLLLVPPARASTPPLHWTRRIATEENCCSPWGYGGAAGAGSSGRDAPRVSEVVPPSAAAAAGRQPHKAPLFPPFVCVALSPPSPRRGPGLSGRGGALRATCAPWERPLSPIPAQPLRRR